MNACWYYRIVREWKHISGAPLPRRVRNHLATCADCARAAGVANALENRLRHEARTLQRPAPPALAVKIERRLRQRVETKVEARPAVRLVLGSALAGIALLAAVAWWAWQRPSPAPSIPLVVAQVYPLDRLDLSHTPFWLERDEDWQRPLRTEMDGLVKDTSSALQHLAQAFLPGERAGE